MASDVELVQADVNTVKVITPGPAGPLGPPGPTGIGGSFFEATLSGSHSAGATTLNLTTSRPTPFAIGTFVVIAPFTTSAEIRRITGAGATSLTVAGLTSTHAANTLIFAFHGGLVPWSWWGAVPGDTTKAPTNVTAFNNLTQQLYGLGTNYYGGIFVPPGLWYIDNELHMERDQILEGAHVMTSRIIAHTTFPFDGTTEVAMFHPRRDGAVVNFATPGPSGRWTLRNIFFDGNAVANANGVISSPQQPDIWANVRADNCPGYGFGISDVQQHIIKNMECVNNGIGLRMRDCEFVFVDGLNIEQSDIYDVLMDASSAGGGCFFNHFENFHLELGSGTATEHFRIDNSGSAGATDNSGNSWEQGWISTGGTNKMFHFVGASTINAYRIRNVRCYGTPSNVLGVVDDYRGLSLNVHDRFNDRIQEYEARLAGNSSAAAPDGQHSYRSVNTDGSEARVGASQGTSSFPVAEFWSNAVSDNTRHARFFSSGTLAFEVKRDGSMMVGAGNAYVRGFLVGSTTWDPGSIADGATASTTVTVTGVAANMPLAVTYTSLGGGWLISAAVTGTDTVTVTILNKTGGAVDLANGTVRVCQVKF